MEHSSSDKLHQIPTIKNINSTLKLTYCLRPETVITLLLNPLCTNVVVLSTLPCYYIKYIETANAVACSLRLTLIPIVLILFEIPKILLGKASNFTRLQ